MKRKLLLSLVATLFILPASADDFSYTSDGKTLNYTILDKSAKTCKVAAFNKVSKFVTIPEVANGYKVTAIGDSAFYGCDDLNNIYIPETVTYIGSRAFYGCDELKLISLDAIIPPKCGKDIVSDYNDVMIRIYPQSLDKYKKADIWKNFTKFDAVAFHIKETLVTIRVD